MMTIASKKRKSRINSQSVIHAPEKLELKAKQDWQERTGSFWKGECTRNVEQRSQKTLPHSRQWCGRSKAEKRVGQFMHDGVFSCHQTQSRIGHGMRENALLKHMLWEKGEGRQGGNERGGACGNREAGKQGGERGRGEEVRTGSGRGWE
jgi:hypothetical protein